MELEIKKYARTRIGRTEKNERSISLIRYADDFVILHKDLEVILNSQKIIENWLEDIGLELKPSKTRISHTLNEYEGNTGFDFLGFNIRQFPVGKHHSGKSSHKETLGFKTIIKPSKDKVKAHIKSLGKVITKHRSSPQIALIKRIHIRIYNFFIDIAMIRNQKPMVRMINHLNQSNYLTVGDGMNTTY
jgi:RNA-directed DNA polymerase